MDIKNIKLLGDKVLIKADNEERKTNSGVIIAKKEEQGDFSTGIVVAIGNGKKTDYGETVTPPNVEIGDKVIFQYGQKIYVEDEQYSLVCGPDIIMII